MRRDANAACVPRVDDVDHWLSSAKREEVFGPLGITVRSFRDPEGSNRVGLIAEIPDMAEWQELMQSEAGADAMKFDGVRLRRCWSSPRGSPAPQPLGFMVGAAAGGEQAAIKSTTDQERSAHRRDGTGETDSRAAALGGERASQSEAPRSWFGMR